MNESQDTTQDTESEGLNSIVKNANDTKVDAKRYNILYHLTEGKTVAIVGDMTESQMKIFLNTFSNEPTRPLWIHQLFKDGKYVINTAQIILVELSVIEVPEQEDKED